MKRTQKPKRDYASENRELRTRLREAEETLAAIRRGEVDAVVVDATGGEKLYKLDTADSTYRRLVETMSEGAATVGRDGLILYCNSRFAAMLGLSIGKIVGTPILDCVDPDSRRAVAALIRSSRRHPGRAEARLACGDGALVPVQIACSSLDEAELVCLVVTDLTEMTMYQGELELAKENLEKRVKLRTEQLQKTNRVLRENYIKYRGLFENIRESVAVFQVIRNKEAAIARVLLCEGNAALAREAGAKTVASLRGKSVVELFGKERAAGYVAAVGEAMAGNRTLTVEWRDEERGRDYLKTFVPLDENRCLVAGPDVTALKEAERRAVQSEERIAQIFQASPVGIFVSRREDGFLFEVNRAFLDIAGHAEEEVIGRTTVQLGLWEDPEERRKLLRAVQESGWLEGYEFRLRRKDGRVIDARVSLVPIEFGTEPCFLGTLADVTAQKRAEELLLAAYGELEAKVAERTAALNKTVDLLSQERRRFHDVLDILPAYVVLLTPDYRVPFANKFFIERFGDSEGKRCYEYLFGRDAPCDNCETYEVLKTMQPKTWEWVGPDNRNYSIFDFPYVDADGVTNILEMGIDVTERLRAEVELARHRDRLEELVQERTAQLERANVRLLEEIEERRRAENRLLFQAAILETVNDAIVGTDLDFRVVYWNKGAERTYGWKTDEVFGRRSDDLLRSRISERERAAYVEALSGGKTIATVMEQAAKDDRWLTVEGYTMPIRDADGAITGYAAVNRDITERRRAEKEIHDLARFPGENPNPILRLTPEGTLLYSNAAGEEITRCWNIGPGLPLPEPWRGLAVAAYERGVNEAAETPCGNRTFAFVIVPLPDRGYINLYGRDITEHKRAQAEVERYIAELKAANDELSRFNRAMVGRELRMVELKREVNELCARTGESPRYAPGEGEARA